MTGPNERLRRLSRVLHFAATRPIVPALVVLVIGVSRSDGDHKSTGYGGMLPLPAPATAPASTARIDPLLEPRHDARTDRGRVLYADGRVTRMPEQTARVVPRKQVCPNQRLVQGRTAAAPNS